MTNYLPNGAEILAIDYHKGVVLAHNKGAYMPYVTWKFYRDDLSTTSYGNYFGTLEAAEDDYKERTL